MKKSFTSGSALASLLFASAACTATQTPEAFDESSDYEPTIALALVNGPQDSIALLNYEGGCLQDTGERLQDVQNPRHIAMRSDSREALIAYGSIGETTGVLVVDLVPGESQATVVQDLNFNVGSNPFGIAYGDDDHAVYVGGVSDLDPLVSLERDSNGAFQIGATSYVQDDFVIAAASAGNTPLLLRGDLGSGESIEMSGLRLDPQGYSMQSAPVQISSGINIASHPTLPVAYVPARTPEQAFDTLSPSGDLNVFSVSDGQARLETTYQLPADGSSIDVSPDGRFLIVDAPVHVVGRNGFPDVRDSRIQVIELGASGMPESGTLLDEVIPMLLFNDLEIAPGGNLILSKELFQGEQPEDISHPVSILKNAGGQFVPACDDLHLGGQVKLSFAQ